MIDISPLYAADDNTSKVVDLGAANAGKCSGGNCDLQSYLKCANGISCACSAARKRAGGHDDVQERIQTLSNKIDDLRDQENINDMQDLLNTATQVRTLEAEVNEYLKGEARQRPPKPRSVYGELICASRKQEKSHVARQLDKVCELSTFVGVAQGSYLGDPEEFERLRQLMNGGE